MQVDELIMKLKELPGNAKVYRSCDSSCFVNILHNGGDYMETTPVRQLIVMKYEGLRKSGTEVTKDGQVRSLYEPENFLKVVLYG